MFCFVLFLTHMSVKANSLGFPISFLLYGAALVWMKVSCDIQQCFLFTSAVNHDFLCKLHKGCSAELRELFAVVLQRPRCTVLAECIRNLTSVNS